MLSTFTQIEQIEQILHALQTRLFFSNGLPPNVYNCESERYLPVAVS